MKDDTDARERRAEAVGLFRYGLISDLMRPDDDDAGLKLYERLRAKAGRSYCIPATKRTRVAVETMRDWMQLYKEGGFDALEPKPRKDLGASHAIPQPVIDELVEMKEQHRNDSVSMVIAEVKKTSAQAGSGTGGSVAAVTAVATGSGGHGTTTAAGTGGGAHPRSAGGCGCVAAGEDRAGSVRAGLLLALSAIAASRGRRRRGGVSDHTVTEPRP